PDWDSAQFADPLLLGSPTSPSAPAFHSVSLTARPVLAWALAALGAELSPALLSVPSSWQTCYSSSRVDLLILRDCTASALITGSLTPSVIGDRPSHTISKPPRLRHWHQGTSLRRHQGPQPRSDQRQPRRERRKPSQAPCGSNLVA